MSACGPVLYPEVVGWPVALAESRLAAAGIRSGLRRTAWHGAVPGSEQRTGAAVQRVLAVRAATGRSVELVVAAFPNGGPHDADAARGEGG